MHVATVHFLYAQELQSADVWQNIGHWPISVSVGRADTDDAQAATRVKANAQEKCIVYEDVM